MNRVLLQCSTVPTHGPCEFCERLLNLAPGRQLVAAETAQPVCDACARKVAPELVALMRLADSAERVGRIASFGIFPPMASLLELAKTAEEFSQVSKPVGARAA